ncbi:MAG TPA: aminodeoxychorismate lyase [Pseudonocardiaceae bacterium]
MRVLAMLDGSLADPDRPLLRADDLGVQRGDGVFETVLVVDGRPRKLDAHLERLARSAALLDLPEPDRAAWRRCAAAACAAWDGPPEMVLKLVLTRGVDGTGVPTAFALGTPVPELVLRQRREGVRVLALDRGYEAGTGERAPWLLIGAKSLSYATNMAAQRYARAHDADDVLFVSSDGWVLEAATASVVVAHGSVLRTPPATAGLLPGTTQQQLFEAAEEAGWVTKVEPLRLDDVLSADGAWLVSSVRQLALIRSVDGRPLRASTHDATLRELLRL